MERRAGRMRVTRRRRVVFGLIVITVLGVLLTWILVGDESLKPGSPPIAVLRVIEGPGVGEAPRFERPLAAAWGPGNSILVSDTGNKRIVEFSSNGGFTREFGGEGTAAVSETVQAEPLVMPVGIDVAPSGDVYVADLGANRVAVYDATGRFVRTFAPAGTREWQPTDVAMGDGVVYVTDQTGVEVFRPDGKRLGRLKIGDAEDALFRPNGVAVGKDGTIYLVDTNRFRLIAVDESGTVLFITSSGDERQRVFGLPRGVSVSEEGTVLVADAFNFSVSEVSTTGALVRRWGARGALPGRFNYPNDVDVSGDLVLVTDKENHRVQVLRLRRDTGRVP